MKNSIVFFLVLITACSKNDEISPGVFTGIISFNTNLSATEPFSNYAIEYQDAFNAGARGAQTAAPWGSLNPSGTNYDFTPVDNPYFGLNSLKGAGFEAIFLNIAIITIDKRSMPSDIISLSFDDPVVKSRFRSLIDAINDRLNDKVIYISLGNEVDTYFATHSGEWTAYINLVNDARDYIHLLRPEVRVGVTTTFEGASVSAMDQIQLLNATMDVVMLTYYPVNNNFSVREPGAVNEDVAKMLSLSDGKPLVMQEWGFPSSAVLGSSEQKQSTFFSNSFAALKRQGVEHFPFVSFFKLRDWNAQHCQTLTGQSAGQNFYEFMSTLGVKHNDKTLKEAYKIIESELK